MLKIDPEQLEHLDRERWISAGFLFIVLAVGLFGLIEDAVQGEPPKHLIVEGSFIVLAILGALYLWNESRKLRSSNVELSRAMLTAHRDADYWREEASTALAGLSEAIDKQFLRWTLTEAESEVGLLLLKGLSLKEISEVRKTSERTVRHQAAALYRKSGLDGRAELSAFFLEDLLLPRPAEKREA